MISSEQARHPELAAFVRERGIKTGKFRLASGRESSYYCDGKLVSFAPKGIALIADAILKEIEPLNVDAVGGMDMGATPIVAAVALRSYQKGHPLPSFVVRKETKDHGTRKAIEGPLPAAPSRVVIIDDVVTSGGSVIQAIDTVRAAGHEVVLAISVLDRMAGGAEALAGKGVRYQPLVTLADLGLTPDEHPAGRRNGS